MNEDVIYDYSSSSSSSASEDDEDLASKNEEGSDQHEGELTGRESNLEGSEEESEEDSDDWEEEDDDEESSSESESDSSDDDSSSDDIIDSQSDGSDKDPAPKSTKKARKGESAKNRNAKPPDHHHAGRDLSDEEKDGDHDDDDDDDGDDEHNEDEEDEEEDEELADEEDVDEREILKQEFLEAIIVFRGELALMKIARYESDGRCSNCCHPLLVPLDKAQGDWLESLTNGILTEIFPTVAGNLRIKLGNIIKKNAIIKASFMDLAHPTNQQLARHAAVVDFTHIFPVDPRDTINEHMPKEEPQKKAGAVTLDPSLVTLDLKEKKETEVNRDACNALHMLF